jgi:putative spermidine/putrescine transport system permease protein
MSDTTAAAPVAVPALRALRSRLARTYRNWGPAVPLLVVLFLCLVVPLATLLARSFITADGVGLHVWQRVLSQPINQRAIVTSLQLGFTCAVISALVGTPLAWLISRMIGRRRASSLGVLNVSAHFGGIGLAFAFVATLGTFGVITQLVQGMGLPFVPPARDSFAALVITYEHANIPLFVLLLVPAMGMLRNEWFEAAETSSATRLQFWRRIGLPILLPFIAAGFVLSFMWTIGIYGIAYALAGQSAAIPIQLITLQIGQALSDDAIRGPEKAAVLSTLLIGLALTALALYRMLLRRGLRWFRTGSSDAAAATADGSTEGPSDSGARRSRWLAALLFVPFGLYLFVPIVAVVVYSFAGRWAGTVLPEELTLRFWQQAFADPGIVRAFVTSLTLGVATTVVVLLLAVPAVYWSRVRNPRISHLLDLSAVIPFALPFVVIGFALLQFTGFAMPWIQGTYGLLVLVYVAVSFPFVYWSLDASMAASSVRTLSEAAATCGASAAQTIVRVVLPAIRPGLATAAMLAFALAIGEFALVKVLAPSVNTISIWSAGELQARGGAFGLLAVVTTTVFVILFALSVAVAYVNRGRTDRSLTNAPDVGRMGQT